MDEQHIDDYEEVDEQYFDVTFISDYFVLTVTAGIHTVTADPEGLAIDIAKAMIIDDCGFDPYAYANDITVEPAFV